MCNRADELAVLDDGRARHECVQVGTTVLNRIHPLCVDNLLSYMYNEFIVRKE